MKRRNFLSLLGAAGLAPALPAFGASAPVAAAAGYNRYMYGLAVFHARTRRTNLSTAGLMARLKINAGQANAILSEMSAKDVLSSVTGASRVAAARTAPSRPYVRKALRHLQDSLDQAHLLCENTDAAPRRCTRGVQAVYPGCDPVPDTDPTTSGGPKLADS